MPSGGLAWTPGYPNAPYVPVWPIEGQPIVGYNQPTCPGSQCALMPQAGTCQLNQSPFYSAGEPYPTVGRVVHLDSPVYKAKKAASWVADAVRKSPAALATLWKGVTNPFLAAWQAKGLGRIPAALAAAFDQAWNAYKAASAPLVDRLVKSGMSEWKAKMLVRAALAADTLVTPGPMTTSMIYAHTERAVRRAVAEQAAAAAQPPYIPEQREQRTAAGCCIPSSNFNLARSFPWELPIYDEQVSPPTPMSVHFRSCPGGRLGQLLNPPCEPKAGEGCRAQLRAGRAAYTTDGSPLDPIELAVDAAKRAAERLGVPHGVWVKRELGVPIVMVNVQNPPYLPALNEHAGVRIRWVPAAVNR